MPPPDPLRVVFFGRARSGKTRLMDAFGTVASAGAEEPVELAIGPQAFAPAGRDVIRRMVSVDLPDTDGSDPSLTLIDCDGEAAGDLLGSATAPDRARAGGQLFGIIRSAAALVVTVDATDTAAQVEDQLGDLRAFLQLLHADRARGREVGGLPVFLTVTKCDQLYRPGHMPDHWFRAIEERKAEARAKFEDVFDGTDGGVFGGLQLELEATADRVPPPPNFQYSADANGAFQVNKLLRDVLAAASQYRDQLRRGKKRLNWTVSAALGLLGLMLVGFLALALTGEPGPLEQLALRVKQVREQEGPPERRLADRAILRNRKQLDDLRANPYFDQLPADARQWWTDRDRELTAYAEYRKRFFPPQFSPAEVRTAAELTRLTADLNPRNGTLAPPPDFEKEWANTEAVRLRDKWATDRDLLVKAEGELHDWYRNLISQATRLMGVEVPDGGWREQVQALLASAEVPPAKPTDAIPGSPAVDVRRGQPLSFAAAFHFERTDLARQDWEFVGRKLADLRDLTDALAGPLDLPEPTADASASLPLGAERWRQLKERFPRATNGSANWSASFFPDPVRRELSRRSRVAAEAALRHVRRMVVAEVAPNGRADTPADWPKLADGLLAKPELQDWSRLVELLLRCADAERPTAGPPVSELATFVRKASFEWAPTAVDVFLPTALLTDAYKPDGKFTITVLPAQGAPRVTLFGSPTLVEQTPRGARYRFAFDAKSAPLVYRPGETLSAELPVKGGAETYKLRWIAPGTASYQFDRLTREPMLEPVAGGLSRPAAGVTLGWQPVKEAVTVPELLPVLK